MKTVLPPSSVLRTGLFASPSRLVVKLALGEMAGTIPTALEVGRGLEQAAERTGHGPVDRILRDMGGASHIVTVHGPAAALALGTRRRGFDDIEQVTGLARTLRIDLPGPADIGDLVDAMRQLSMVEEASPYYLCRVPMGQPLVAPDLEAAWAQRALIRAAEAMGHEPGDPAVVLAVVDTGVAQTHPEFAGRLRAGFDCVQLGSGDLAAGLELLGDDNTIDKDPEDEVGHGTACAGIIGALGRDIPPGLAGLVSLLPIRVLGGARYPGEGEPMGIGALVDIDMGVKMAIDLQAKVLNLSFGTPADALDAGAPLPHADIVRYGEMRGCIMIAASGNTGRQGKVYPAAHEQVIAVGAAGADRRPAAFSTWGSHVALAAPGEHIITTGLTGYQSVSGTSFAAPFVAAAVALLVSRANRLSQPFDGTAARRILCESAQPWQGGSAYGHGAGILDAYAALQQLDREIAAGPLPPPPVAHSAKPALAERN
jgi:subtilisin family serine protease